MTVACPVCDEERASCLCVCGSCQERLAVHAPVSTLGDWMILADRAFDMRCWNAERARGLPGSSRGSHVRRWMTARLLRRPGGVPLDRVALD